MTVFSKKFLHFFGVCRLGYLKCPLCKASRSELFPIPLPRKGMETLLLLQTGANSLPTFQYLCPERGWKPFGINAACAGDGSFQYLCPERGWKHFYLFLELFLKLPFQYLCPERGWKHQSSTQKCMLYCTFPIPLPRKGMETRRRRRISASSYVTFRYLCPERGLKSLSYRF